MMCGATVATGRTVGGNGVGGGVVGSVVVGVSDGGSVGIGEGSGVGAVVAGTGTDATGCPTVTLLPLLAPAVTEAIVRVSAVGNAVEAALSAVGVLERVVAAVADEIPEALGDGRTGPERAMPRSTPASSVATASRVYAHFGHLRHRGGSARRVCMGSCSKIFVDRSSIAITQASCVPRPLSPYGPATPGRP